MEMWADVPFTITYDFDFTGSQRNLNAACNHFANLPNKHECKFLYRHDHMCPKHIYWPFKKQWSGDRKGPIAIYLNHEFKLAEDKRKFFDEKTNNMLLSLIDNKNYFSLGIEHSFDECLDIMSRCRYVIGLEGGWTHISHAMRVPYIICRNKRPKEMDWYYHPNHPDLQVIQNENLIKYLTL